MVVYHLLIGRKNFERSNKKTASKNINFWRSNDEHFIGNAIKLRSMMGCEYFRFIFEFLQFTAID